MDLKELINNKIDLVIEQASISESYFNVLDSVIDNFICESSKSKKRKKKKNKPSENKDNTKFLKKIGVDSKDSYDKSKLKSVSELLSDPKINGAEIARQLWNLTPDEEDSGRSLFSKKRRSFVDDSGHKYGFTPVEVNKLYSILTV